MESLKESILKSVKAGKYSIYTLFPKDKDELVKMIKDEIRKNGNNCSLNHIDTSKITDMSNLFSSFIPGYHLEKFDGDISEWNVSKVKNMKYMFTNSKFNGDISYWNVSGVENMDSMFFGTIFNRDISAWNVSNVKNMESMFHVSKFNGNISKWNVSGVENMCYMFSYSSFNNDISNWNINPNCDTYGMFGDCKIKDNYKPFKNKERIK